MKIVAVVGSLRKGNTLKMVQAACSSITTDEVEIIDLSKISLQFCTGCLYCDEAKQCNINDDMSNLIDKIKDANGYIFASPVRWSLLSGEMKTFFDRLNPLATTGILSKKKCVLFVVGQSDISGDETFSIDAGLQSMKFFCENAGVEIVDSVKAYGCLSEDDITNTSYLKQCVAASGKLIESLK
jgi:multimeric flavodoxin WrbA